MFYKRLVPVLFLFLFFGSSVSANIKGHEIKTIDEEGRSYRIETEYPSFQAGDIPAGAVSSVNKEVEEFIKGYFSSVLLEMKKQDAELSDEDLEVHKGSVSGGKNFSTTDFKIIRADDRYVSIRFENYFYGMGNVHGFYTIFSFNYDVVRQKMISLEDLFEPGSAYLEDVSQICITSLIDQLQEGALESVIRSGASAEKENFKAFAIDDREIIIYFQNYQVASYSAGLPEVKISFDQLKGLQMK